MNYRDKKLRHELKYYINYHEYFSLRQRLKHAIQKDKNGIGDTGYHIRSLYFDDIYDSALYEKNFGVFERKKYRIRIYNLSDAVINLERKMKFGQYIAKESVKLTRSQYNQILSKDVDFLRVSKNKLMNEFYAEIKNKLLAPKVIVDYEREAYILNAGNVRITFDKFLKAGINSLDIFDSHVAVMDIIKPPLMILEVKFDDFLPDYVRNCIQIFSHNQSAISKYVMCREMLNNTK